MIRHPHAVRAVATAATTLAFLGTVVGPALACCCPCPPHHTKVYVCKYVGTPGVDEHLKSGRNPIRVSSTATVGSWFNDAQGRSYVLATYQHGHKTPTAADCPTGDVIGF